MRPSDAARLANPFLRKVSDSSAIPYTTGSGTASNLLLARRSLVDCTKFDALSKTYGSGTSRRALLKGILGLGGGLLAGSTLAGRTEAARRGYRGPIAPLEPNDLQICPALGCCAMCVQSIPVMGQFVSCVQ